MRISIVSSKREKNNRKLNKKVKFEDQIIRILCLQ